MRYSAWYLVGTTPVDNDKLNNEAMYGASKSMQVLRSHVGIGFFIECLSDATRTIVQTTSVVTGIKADSRSGVGLSLNTGGGATSVADLISATFLSKWSAKASAESPGSARGAPSPPLPNPLLITRHRDAWSRPVSTRDLQKCFRFDRTKRCIVFNDPIQLSRAASVRDLLKRRSCPLARRLAERHSESYHPSEDRRTRQVISVIGAWASSKAVTTSSRREAITEASSPRESSSPNVELMKPSQRQDD